MIQNKPSLTVVVICLTIIGSFYLTSKTGIYIKSLGGAVESGGQVSNTISVTGAGEVTAKPDMALFSFSFSETAPTSQAALDKVNQKITAALKIIRDSGISDKDISTGFLGVSPQYDWSVNPRRLTGQAATQSVDVKMKKIDDKAAKVTALIDKLSEINNIQLNGVSFDIEDKTDLFKQARELAYNKARDKAAQLAKLSSVNLLKPVSIVDTNYDVSPQPYLENVAMLKSASVDSGGGASIPTGELTIKANLNILWGIQ